MIIIVERSGGFAGMTLRSEIDTEQLDPAERQKLTELVSASNFFNTSLDSATAPTGADRFQYVITITTESQERTVELNEVDIPSEWQDLIQLIIQLARRHRR